MSGGKWLPKRRTAIFRVLMAACCLVAATAFAYFVPGLPDSPLGGHSRDLGRAFLTAVVSLLVVAFMLRFVVLG
jgi:hypothetical protein